MRISPALYLELFKSRSDTYARQRDDGAYIPVDREFGEEQVEEHLSGEKTYGQYVVNPDGNEVKFAAIDNDIETDADAPLSNALEAAKEERQRAINLGLKESQCWIEFSGRRGYHLWMFFENPIPAVKSKRLLEYIVDGTPEERKEADEDEDVGVVIDGGHHEVFPKQIVVEEGEYGNLIKTPLGYHKATDNRMVFVDDEGEPVPDQGATLRAAVRNRIPEDTIDGILGELGEVEEEMVEQVEEKASQKGMDASDVIEDDYDIRPCIASALMGEMGDLKGEQGHLMRFAAGTELLANGFSVDEAVEFYRRFPQFDEGVTRKKLNEIEDDGYKPWKCSTLKEQCPKYAGDCDCPYQTTDAVDQMDMNRRQYGKNMR